MCEGEGREGKVGEGRTRGMEQAASSAGAGQAGVDNMGHIADGIPYT